MPLYELISNVTTHGTPGRTGKTIARCRFTYGARREIEFTIARFLVRRFLFHATRAQLSYKPPNLCALLLTWTTVTEVLRCVLRCVPRPVHQRPVQEQPFALHLGRISAPMLGIHLDEQFTGILSLHPTRMPVTNGHIKVGGRPS
jgi:hypothetical protein